MLANTPPSCFCFFTRRKPEQCACKVCPSDSRGRGSSSLGPATLSPQHFVEQEVVCWALRNLLWWHSHGDHASSACYSIKWCRHFCSGSQSKANSRPPLFRRQNFTRESRWRRQSVQVNPTYVAPIFKMKWLMLLTLWGQSICLSARSHDTISH